MLLLGRFKQEMEPVSFLPSHFRSPLDESELAIDSPRVIGDSGDLKLEMKTEPDGEKSARFLEATIFRRRFGNRPTSLRRDLKRQNHLLLVWIVAS
ncbi:hypothetical protein JCGZ_24408 [Jatropha curcas]|uniref:Uncharacterized protein n=1 Tax=Jatropha curcas TaxID=180498 RepID=A0A067JM46_JATCU|nr:hypothetical protein JCGZ_24408 [Jatropha curcas]